MIPAMVPPGFMPPPPGLQAPMMGIAGMPGFSGLPMSGVPNMQAMHGLMLPHGMSHMAAPGMLALSNRKPSSNKSNSSSSSSSSSSGSSSKINKSGASQGDVPVQSGTNDGELVANGSEVVNTESDALLGGGGQVGDKNGELQKKGGQEVTGACPENKDVEDSIAASHNTVTEGPHASEHATSSTVKADVDRAPTEAQAGLDSVEDEGKAADSDSDSSSSSSSSSSSEPAKPTDTEPQPATACAEIPPTNTEAAVQQQVQEPATTTMVATVVTTTLAVSGVMPSDRNPSTASLFDVEDFLQTNVVDPEAAARLRALPVQLQQRVLERGDLRDTRNPSAVLIARVRDAENGVLSQDGLGQPAPPSVGDRSVAVSGPLLGPIPAD